MPKRNLQEDLALCKSIEGKRYTVDVFADDGIYDDRLGCVKSPTKTKKDPIAEKYVSEAIQALPYWLEEVRRLNKALELVLSVNADDGCPGCSFSPKFEGWQECNNCPANYEETDYDTNLAYWKRYYLEKAAEVQNG